MIITVSTKMTDTKEIIEKKHVWELSMSSEVCVKDLQPKT